MEIPKPTEDDRRFFLGLIPDDPEVEVKPMFGNLGAFVRGNMFAGLFGPDVGVRLGETAQRELAAGWVARALTHVGALPPKVKKPRKAKR